MKRLILSLFFLPSLAMADVGVLVPWSIQHEPDPSILSLKRMDVTIRIDHLHARVEMRSVFQNHTNQQIEGRYLLPLGDRASIEDFSVWQGEERLLGTIVEKQKGRKLFEQIVRQQIDPGLAESDDDDDKGRTFAIRVAPIPPHGTARVEVVFSEDLPITSRGVLFTMPWKPRRHGTQKVGALHVDISVDGPYKMAGVKVLPAGFKWTAAPTAGCTRFAGTLDVRNHSFGDDMTVEMSLADGAVKLDGLAYRDAVPGGRKDISPFGDGTVYRDSRGYLMVRGLLGEGKKGGRQADPREVVVLLDTSLSMQWEKLERSFAALEYFLGRLGPADRFAVVPFSDEVRAPAELQPASAASTSAALRMVRDSSLGGGTDIGAALASALGLLARAPRPDAARFVVLISDGNPTLGEIDYKKIGVEFDKANREGGARAGQAGKLLSRLFVLGVGDDAASALLGRLASAADGYFAWAREGSDTAFMFRTFFDKLGQSSLREVVLAIAGLTGITQIYPEVHALLFDGSDATYFSRYATPGKVSFSLRGREQGASAPRTIGEALAMTLPERDTGRSWVARGWARHRIGWLLDAIAVEGEKQEWVREVIALAKEFHFVTPYTSFIAAPRAMLRPRVIQPGDPVLRVKVASDIREVVAVFPFGLTKALRYLPGDDVWETRFLAPTWMKDGTYSCLLVMTDGEGRKISESKTFVIDSKPPEIQATATVTLARAGDDVRLDVRADADTRRILARIGDGPATEIIWDAQRKCSTGILRLPSDTPTGATQITVMAEDMARNVSSRQLTLNVIGGR